MSARPSRRARLRPGRGTVAVADDPRTVGDGARPRELRRLVVAVQLLGAVALAVALQRVQGGPADLGAAFWLVCGLCLLTEGRPLLAAGGSAAGGLTLSTAFVFAVLLRHGLPAALLLQAASTAVEHLAQRRALWRTGFNLGQFVLSWTAAAGAMTLVGHVPGLDSPASLGARDLLTAAAGGVAYFAANELLVAWALSAFSGSRLRQVLREDAGYEVLTTVALLALAPLVCLAMERGAAFVPLLVPPVLAVYAVSSVAVDRERRSMTDALTGLPNRRLLHRRAGEALREGPVALVLFDLDRFKEVNDTLGHHVGDRLLQVVADRMTGALRPCDTVARLGGDEFALVLPHASAAAARATAERLRQVVGEPVVLEGLRVDVDASAGVAVSPDHGGDVDALLQHADVAMYLSKDSGAVEVYDPERDRNTPGRLAMLGDLRRALERGELELHYQPGVALLDGSVAGVEALVRWHHPERGLVPPDEFVPLAESSGLVPALTAYVLDAGLRQLAAWQAQGLPLRLAVNVSVRDLCGDRLARDVERGLLRYGIAPSRLVLEVTEGSLLAEPVRAAPTRQRLGELGVDLSLDDFGTGYSSLSYLRQLEVREIKVDRSFVSRLDDPRDLAVVRSVVDLGRGLGMRVVAEGVEDALSYHRLAAMGCDVAQGRFLSPPLPAAELTPWLLERAGAPTVQPA